MSEAPVTQLTAWRPWMEWAFPALACVLLGAQMMLSEREISLTGDEATHLDAGMQNLVCRQFLIAPEHPPLVGMVAAAAALGSGLQPDCTPPPAEGLAQARMSVDWLLGQAWQAPLEAARMAVSGAAFALLLLVWGLARSMFGRAAACIAVALVAFEPTVLGFGPLVMTDVAAGATMAGGIAAAWWWLTTRRPLALLSAGVTVGLALLTKHSGDILFPCLVLVVGAEHLRHPVSPLRSVRGDLLGLAGIALVAVATLWTGYGLSGSPSPTGAPAEAGGIIGLVAALGLLPPPYLTGLAGAAHLASGASIAYASGRFYSTPPWFALPLTLGVRLTVPVMVLSALSLAGARTVLRERPLACLLLGGPTLVFLAVMSRALSTPPIRYLLPVYPLLVVVIAGALARWATGGRGRQLAIGGLLLAHAASSLQAFPNYLTFNNGLFGGPLQTGKLLPWNDMGQGYIQAREWLQQNPTDPCWLLTDWFWSPDVYDVPCHAIGPRQPGIIPPHISGTILVSSTLAARDATDDFEIAEPFRNAAPSGEIGDGTLLVYRGDFDMTMASALSVLRQPRAASFTLLDALDEYARAVAVAPTSPYIRMGLCHTAGSVATATGDAGMRQQAIAACQTFIDMAEAAGDPMHHRDAELARPVLARMEAGLEK